MADAKLMQIESTVSGAKTNVTQDQYDLLKKMYPGVHKIVNDNIVPPEARKAPAKEDK